MRGISEERLMEILNNSHGSNVVILDALLKECKELNSWQPIESAPRDRRLLLFYPGIQKPYIGQWLDLNGKVGYWDYIGLMYASDQPTHWQELPEDPK